MENLEAHEEEFCELIRSLASSYDHLGQAYADRHGIYPTDFRALVLIDGRGDDEENITAGELATALGLSSGAVTYLVERLTQGGHARRAVDPADRRKVRLVATQRGHELVAGHALPVAEAIAQSMEGADEAFVQLVSSATRRLAEGLDARAVDLAREALPHARR